MIVEISMYGQRTPFVTGDHYAGCSCGRTPRAPRREGDARRHHVVPQMWLRGFASADDVTLRGTEVDTTPVPISSVLWKRDFYSTLDDQGRRDVTIENGLAQIEGFIAPILCRVREDKLICDTDRQWLAAFLGLLWTRTPSMRTVAYTAAAASGSASDYASSQHDGRTQQRHRTPSAEVLGLMLSWGIDSYGRAFWSYEWELQAVPEHRLCTTAEPVTRLRTDAHDCFLVALSHRLALWMYPQRHPPGFNVVSPQINWLTTRFSDKEVFWHPSASRHRVLAPWWAPIATLDYADGRREAAHTAPVAKVQLR